MEKEKTKKKLIDKQLAEALTIGQLIKYLKTLPADIYIGTTGHYGEAYLMDKDDFSQISKGYIVPSGSPFRDGNEQDIKILDLFVPDIGPEPD